MNEAEIDEEERNLFAEIDFKKIHQLASGGFHDDVTHDVTLDANDLTDPDLLGELQELGWEGGPDEDGGMGGGEPDYDNMDPDELEKMLENDPEAALDEADQAALMADMEAHENLGPPAKRPAKGAQTKQPVPTAKPMQKQQAAAQPAKPTTQPQSKAAPSKPAPAQQTNSKANPQAVAVDGATLLNEAIKKRDEAKRAAVAFKQAGKMKEAGAAVARMKELNAQIAALEQDSSAKGVAAVAKNVAGNVEARLDTIRPAPTAKAEAVDEEMLAIRSQEYKMAAIAAKKGGDVEAAKRLLLVSKQLDALLERLQDGGQVSPADVPPSLSPSQSQQGKGSSSSSSSSGEPAKPKPQPQLNPHQKEYEIITHQLENQMQTLTEKMKFFCKDDGEEGGGKGGEKKEAGRSSKIAALDYLRLKKATRAAAQEVAEAMAAGKPPPALRVEKKTFTHEIINDEIPDDVIEMTIVNFQVDRSFKQVSGEDLSPYVLWDTDYPALQKGESSTGTGPNPTFNYVVPVKVEKPSKNLARKLKFHKINIEVWHRRRLWKHVLIGKGSVKTKDLLEKADVTEPVKVKLDLKNTGTVDVRLRIRQPLEGKDVRVVELNYITVDWSAATATASSVPVQKRSTAGGANDNAGARQLAGAVMAVPGPTQPQPRKSSGAAQPTAQSQQQQPAQPSAARPSTATAQPPAAQPAPTAQKVAAASPAQPAKPKGPAGADLNDPHSVYLMVSNDVLEAEKQAAIAKIAQLKAQKAEEDELFEWEDRKSSIELQLQILEGKVSEGQLSMEGYLEQVKVAMQRDKGLAVQLSQAGRKPDAIQVLRRVKLMEEEIRGAEAAQQEE